MKLIPSKLQLKRAFTTDVHVQANPRFKAKEPMNMALEDISAEFKVHEPAGSKEDWAVELRVFFAGSEKVNAPYAFRIDLLGYFAVLGEKSKQKAKWLVETNAPSVLFSSAREILRATMSSGPYKSLVLPTVSFYTPKAKADIKRIEKK